MTDGGEAQTYAYEGDGMVDANNKLSIEATYATQPQGSSQGTLACTMNGVTWGGEQAITFSFGDAAATESGTGDSPAVGTLYKGCYVLAASGHTATLLHSHEKAGVWESGMTSDALQARIAEVLSSDEFAVEGLSGWRLPNTEEMALIQEKYQELLNTYQNTESPYHPALFYFYQSDSGITSFLGNTSSLTNVPVDAKTILRPVTVIQTN